MSGELPIHNSVRILLINDQDKLLLMCADDPKTTSKDGTYHGKFWFPIGGQIEPGEELINTAIREIKEETGLEEQDVTFGPKVWFGEFVMIISGRMNKLKQQYIVAHTKKSEITLQYLTKKEKEVIKEAKWFSLLDINQSEEVIYPTLLSKYLPEILNKNYPKEPIWIDLAKKPINKVN